MTKFMVNNFFEKGFFKHIKIYLKSWKDSWKLFLGIFNNNIHRTTSQYDIIPL